MSRTIIDEIHAIIHYNYYEWKKLELIQNLLSEKKTPLASDSVRTCPKCSGSGRVEDVCNHLAFTKECELCDGVGKVPAESDTKRMK